MALSTVLALGAIAPLASAQSCWPTSAALVLRDTAGVIVSPEDVDSVHTVPGPRSRHGSPMWRRSSEALGGIAGPDSATVLFWPPRGGCTVRVDSVTVFHQGRRMVLLPALRWDTERTPGPSDFVFDAPSLADGRWVLAADAIERSEGRPRIVPRTAWRRVDEESPPR